MVINIDDVAGGGGGAGDPTTEYFTPSNGQTIFNLAQAPANPEDTLMKVNSLTYSEGNPTPGIFSVSGNVLTWLDRDFTLDTTDEVEVIYFV